MQYLCMRLVSTMSSPLHAAIGSAIASSSSFLAVSRACITAALILHESAAIWAQVLSAAMGPKVIKACKGAKPSKEQAKALKSSKEAKAAKDARDGGNKPSRNRPAVVRDMS